MTEKLRLMTAIGNFLADHPEESYTSKEIADHIHKVEYSGGDSFYRIYGYVSNLLSRNIQEIKNVVCDASVHPKKFYCSQKDSTLHKEPVDAPRMAQADTLNEHSMYPMTCQYLYREHDVYAMRIDESRSSNSGGAGANRWLHPDIVGVRILSDNWHPDVQKYAEIAKTRRFELWSLEVKLRIYQGNVRESFFQTVANSSWANYAYLVALRVEGEDALEELQMLCSRHGIGLVIIDAVDSEKSQVRIPARENLEVDWTACSRLAKENQDFRKYMDNLLQLQEKRRIYHPWDVKEDSS